MVFMKNYLNFMTLFFATSALASIPSLKPDIRVEKKPAARSSLKSVSGSPKRYTLPEIELDFYFIKGTVDGNFVADPAQAKCENYESFRDFLKAVNFKAIDNMSEGVVAAAYGDVFLPHGRSCFELESAIFSDLPKIAVMNYRVAFYATSEMANQELKTYVESLEGRTFFGKDMSLEKVEMLQCGWILNSFLDGEWVASTEYHSVEPGLLSIHREMNRLGDLMAEQPVEKAQDQFLNHKTLSAAEKSKFINSSKVANMYELMCDLKVVSGRKTHLTYWGRSQGYSCLGTKCTQVAEW